MHLSLEFRDENNILNNYNQGNTAVLCFFTLSGYLMTKVLNEKYLNNLNNFIYNRYVRLVPVFVSTLILSIIVHYILLSNNFHLINNEGLQYHFDLPLNYETIFSLSNILYNLLDFPTAGIAGNIIPDKKYVYVRYTWALIVEMKFYILIYITFISHYFFSTKLVFIFAIALSIVIYLFVKLGILGGPFNSFSYAPFFLIGVLLYLCKNKNSNNNLNINIYSSLILTLLFIFSLFELSKTSSDTSSTITI